MQTKKTLLCNLGLMALATWFWLNPNSAAAIKFMSLEEAVKLFVPKGDSVVKITKTLTQDQKLILSQEYGFKPQADSFVFYAAKNLQSLKTAYVFVQPEIFNTCFHKFAVGLKPDGTVIDTVIVELSCPRALPINKKSFLGQFRNKRHQDPLTTQMDIDAVTGATLSSEVAAQATRKAVSLHQLFFSGEKSAKTSDAVRQARDKGASKIEAAITSGETLDTTSH